SSRIRLIMAPPVDCGVDSDPARFDRIGMLSHANSYRPVASRELKERPARNTTIPQASEVVAGMTKIPPPAAGSRLQLRVSTPIIAAVVTQQGVQQWPRAIAEHSLRQRARVSRVRRP